MLFYATAGERSKDPFYTSAGDRSDYRLFDASAGDRSHYRSCFMLLLWIGLTTDPM